jgi:hypothetical protein
MAPHLIGWLCLCWFASLWVYRDLWWTVQAHFASVFFPSPPFRVPNVRRPTESSVRRRCMPGSNVLQLMIPCITPPSLYLRCSPEQLQSSCCIGCYCVFLFPQTRLHLLLLGSHITLRRKKGKMARGVATSADSQESHLCWGVDNALVPLILLN